MIYTFIFVRWFIFARAEAYPWGEQAIAKARGFGKKFKDSAFTIEKTAFPF